MGHLDFWQLLTIVQHELLLFAGVFFLIGALDDILVDGIWVWLKLTGKAQTPSVDRNDLVDKPLNGPLAVFVPAWQEAAVIGDTVMHALTVWPQADVRLYVGCYSNDPDTISAVMEAAARLGRTGDDRLRIVIHDREGPSTKADCLNRLHKALRADERRSGRLFTGVVFHDAEDMVDPGALSLLDEALAKGADFVQIPVEPVAQSNSKWLGSHYCEEFAESHGKALIVRNAIGAGLPAAGVGCAISRRALHQLSRRRIDGSPFDASSLTEDYELGLTVAQMGGRTRYIRARGEDGTFIATRAYFPAIFSHIVRQKTRWVHGIALQSWNRIGWNASLVETWMRARDRGGPLTALVLMAGYLLLVLSLVLWGAREAGLTPDLVLSPFMRGLIALNFANFAWRAAWRFGFTAQSHGWAEGLRAVLRIPFANVIAILAGRRAVAAYARTLMGKAVEWDKTQHVDHPAATASMPTASLMPRSGSHQRGAA
ncbi:MAG: glycosyl transferase family protein [Pseudomonadota bacterium]